MLGSAVCPCPLQPPLLQVCMTKPVKNNSGEPDAVQLLTQGLPPSSSPSVISASSAESARCPALSPTTSSGPLQACGAVLPKEQALSTMGELNVALYSLLMRLVEGASNVQELCPSQPLPSSCTEHPRCLSTARNIICELMHRSTANCRDFLEDCYADMLGGSKTCVKPPLSALVLTALASDVKACWDTEKSSWPPACHSALSYLAVHICLRHRCADDRQQGER